MNTQYISPLFVVMVIFSSCSKGDTEKPNKEQFFTRNSSIGYKIELVAEELYVPWSIVFTDSLRILVTERNGNLRVIKNGVLGNIPLLQLRFLNYFLFL